MTDKQLIAKAYKKISEFREEGDWEYLNELIDILDDATENCSWLYEGQREKLEKFLVRYQMVIYDAGNQLFWTAQGWDAEAAPILYDDEKAAARDCKAMGFSDNSRIEILAADDSDRFPATQD